MLVSGNGNAHNSCHDRVFFGGTTTPMQVQRCLRGGGDQDLGMCRVHLLVYSV